GKDIAHQFSRQLAEHGITIVSGMAHGIDAAAHMGALEAGGRTIAVLGCGVDRIYPSDHRALAARITESGALLSEFPMGSRPEAKHFPRRNRLLSGISLGVLIVEAALRSGALITASHAAEQGREVFAVPGSIHQPGSEGTHALIQEGAKLAHRVDDILDELNIVHEGAQSRAAAERLAPGDEIEALLLESLSREPLHIDCNDKKFPDLMVLNQEERRSLEEAYECWVLGCLFDVLEFKGGEYLWQERDGFQMRPHPLGDRHMMLVKLTTGTATREKLYKLVKQRRDAVLSTQDEQEMAAYCALLEHYKREAYGEKWGKVSSESELPFEDMMTVRVLSDEVQHVMESPLVRSLGPEAIGQKAEEVMARAEQFTRRREDGKLALLAATQSKS
ncbi:DNA-protecting protein DprA, partial [bacterium CPR1]|nr:DNA-protecting protein DprA [bacterium CPR1]